MIFYSCNHSSVQQNDLSNTIIRVVKAFEEKDIKTLNNLISSDLDLTVLYRQGVFNQYSKVNKLDFDKPVPENFAYPDFATDYNLKYDELPTFDCDNMKWSKTGLFCDTLNVDNLLSTTAVHLKQFVKTSIPDSEIENFKEMEKNSVRVVLTDNHNGELIFYLTLVDNKWYFTILDRLSGDCSA